MRAGSPGWPSGTRQRQTRRYPASNLARTRAWPSAIVGLVASVRPETEARMVAIMGAALWYRTDTGKRTGASGKAGQLGCLALCQGGRR